MDYSFNCEVAKQYGVDEAVFIHNLYWWIRKNAANGRHEYEGKTWTYNSARAFSTLFPFWTERQVRRIIKTLTENGVIFIGNFNQDQRDRTQWYAISDDIYKLYGDQIIAAEDTDNQTNTTKTNTTKTVKCNYPNGQMQPPKPSHSCTETVTPLPDSKPDSKLLLHGAETPCRPVIEIILNDKTNYGVTQKQVERWRELYPAVDILAQLRAMAGWSDANPLKRKTSKGIERFINSWLTREQDKGGSLKAKAKRRVFND